MPDPPDPNAPKIPGEPDPNPPIPCVTETKQTPEQLVQEIANQMIDAKMRRPAHDDL
jgi:hypothetical protein